MEKHGRINAAAFLADKSKNNSYHKSINTLNHIHMEHTKEQCLQEVSNPERHCSFGIFQSQSTENQFFTDRSNQNGIENQNQGRLIQSHRFYQVTVIFQPVRVNGCSKRYNVIGNIL